MPFDERYFQGPLCNEHAKSIAELQERSRSTTDWVKSMEDKINKLEDKVDKGFEIMRKDVKALSDDIKDLKNDKKWEIWIFGAIVTILPAVIRFLLEHWNTVLIK